MCMGGLLFAWPAKVYPGLVQYMQNGFRVASITSHFSNNYLKFIYVLGYTERLAFRGLMWFTKHNRLIFDVQ